MWLAVGNYQRFNITFMTKYVKNTYENIADEYAEEYINDFSNTPYIDKFLALLPPGAKVLDVGSGPGQFSDYVHRKGFIVEGVDMSPAMLKIAREKFPETTFSEMDMRSLNFQENSFDGLLVAYSLIHIPSAEIASTLNEFQRVLKNGGYILVIAQKGETDQVIDEPLKAGERIFVNFFNLEQLKQYLADANFEVVEAEEVKSSDPNSLSTAFLSIIGKK